MTAAGYIAWDLDGVLFDSDELHYLAVNEVLRAYGEHITKAEHLATFKGLPTLKKCEMLTAMGRLPATAHGDVSRRKQAATREAISQAVRPSGRVGGLLLALSAAGWRQCCCSNSIRDTVRRILVQLEVVQYMDFYLSNEDVVRAKPHPDMYTKAATCFGISARELVVVEDAEPGRQAALAAGCALVAVGGPHEVGPELVHRILAVNREVVHA